MGVGGLVESSCFHSPLGFMETAGALSPKTKDPRVTSHLPLRELLLTKSSQHSVVTKQPPVANRMWRILIVLADKPALSLHSHLPYSLEEEQATKGPPSCRLWLTLTDNCVRVHMRVVKQPLWEFVTRDEKSGWAGNKRQHWVSLKSNYKCCEFRLVNSRNCGTVWVLFKVTQWRTSDLTWTNMKYWIY